MNAVFNASRTFAVPAALLFDAITERLDEWWGGAVVALEIGPGGRFEVGDEVGVVKKVEEPQKLSIELGQTLAMLVLMETPTGTSLQVLHTRFGSGEERDAYAPRWEARLDRLAAIVA